MLSPLAAVKPSASAAPVPEYVAADHRTSKFPVVVEVIASAHGLEVQVLVLCCTTVNDSDAATANVRFTDLVWLPESVTENVSVLALTAAVGVPLIAPVVVSKLKLAGRDPDVRDQV